MGWRRTVQSEAVAPQLSPTAGRNPKERIPTIRDRRRYCLHCFAYGMFIFSFTSNACHDDLRSYSAVSSLTLLVLLDSCRLLCDITFMKDLGKIVSASKEVLGGTPVFVGTRVPVRNLIDCLEAGDSIDLFLYDFPTVRREQVIAVLESAKRDLLEAVPA